MIAALALVAVARINVMVRCAGGAGALPLRGRVLDGDNDDDDHHHHHHADDDDDYDDAADAGAGGGVGGGMMLVGVSW